MELVSWDDDIRTFPIYGKIKFMFQTTNQFFSAILDYEALYSVLHPIGEIVHTVWQLETIPTTIKDFVSFLTGVPTCCRQSP